ncbi:MAG TPA: ATP-binding protein [Thermoplasmata archaeon]|nr:ATP-binding protein [Thermoplasmata archaeon]
MVEFAPSLLRAFASLEDGVGRTVAITGPPLSGKSAILEAASAHVESFQGRVVFLRAAYRDRATPLATVAGLADLEFLRTKGGEIVRSSAAIGPAESEAAAAYVPEPITPEPRRRRSAGSKSAVAAAILGGSARTRSAAALEPEEFWHNLSAAVGSGELRSLTILVDDAALADAPSREFLAFLSDRVRFRPVLLILALDTSAPGYSLWEERLVARADVDWVKLTASRPEPREARKVREGFAELPAPTQRLLGVTALLGGSATEVNLSRIARSGFRGLADLLLPATEAGLVRVVGGRVTLVGEGAAAVLADLFPLSDQREMHRELAEALSALNPEPDLARRLEIAGHFFAWNRGPQALRYLLEAAELSERLGAFDTSVEALDRALVCVTSLPSSDRADAEAELRLFRARILVFCGRVAEAERDIAEGVDAALRAQLPTSRLEEWLEDLVPALRVAGPHPSLVTLLGEVADRAHDAAAVDCEVLLLALSTEFETLRGRSSAARGLAERAAMLGGREAGQAAQGLGLLSLALVRLDGPSDERDRAVRYLRSASVLFRANRRPIFEQVVDELLERLRRPGSEVRRPIRSPADLADLERRPRGPLLELEQSLNVAEHLLDTGSDVRIETALARARAIAARHHLVPPSPPLLRLWLAEGRHAASTDPARARDLLRSIVDLPPAGATPAARAEAIARLRALEQVAGDQFAVESLSQRLDSAELRAFVRPEWLPPAHAGT